MNSLGEHRSKNATCILLILLKECRGVDGRVVKVVHFKPLAPHAMSSNLASPGTLDLFFM